MELLLIGVVALLVVGPERLPKLARTAGLWVGRARRALSSVKDEIDREIKADELREILRKQSESRPLESILEEGAGLEPKAQGGRNSTRATDDADSEHTRPLGVHETKAGDRGRPDTDSVLRHPTGSADPP
jgi:sec-independent protein translocase protein TatB